MINNLSRRGLLKLSELAAASAVASFVTTPAQADQIAQIAPPRIAPPRKELPPDVGRKFYPDGRVQAFRGNTIVCHLDQQGENATFFNALLDIYRDAPRHGFMDKVTLLPPSSYHMTIFGCANDQDRKPGAWPAHLPLDTPMDACDRDLGERLRAFQLDVVPPYRMRIDLSEPSQQERPLTIRLLPADDAENNRLRALRNRLSEAVGIRTPNHDAYRFHVTLGYLFRWLTPEEDAVFRLALRGWREQLAAACPEVGLGAPEYCTLKDMFAFDRQFFLS